MPRWSGHRQYLGNARHHLDLGCAGPNERRDLGYVRINYPQPRLRGGHFYVSNQGEYNEDT